MNDFLNHRVVFALVNKGPLRGDARNHYHVIIFRRILEYAITQGRWSGMTFLRS